MACSAHVKGGGGDGHCSSTGQGQSALSIFGKLVLSQREQLAVWHAGRPLARLLKLARLVTFRPWPLLPRLMRGPTHGQMHPDARHDHTRRRRPLVLRSSIECSRHVVYVNGHAPAHASAHGNRTSQHAKQLPSSCDDATAWLAIAGTMAGTL